MEKVYTMKIYLKIQLRSSNIFEVASKMLLLAVKELCSEPDFSSSVLEVCINGPSAYILMLTIKFLTGNTAHDHFG